MGNGLKKPEPPIDGGSLAKFAGIIALAASLAFSSTAFAATDTEEKTASKTGADTVEGPSDDAESMVGRMIKVRGKNPNCGFDGYDVLSVGRDGSEARASVRVRYSVYQVPGQPMKRRRVSVIDFPMDEVHLNGVGGGRQQRSDSRKVGESIDVDFRLIRNLQERFRAKMEELLTQGRRFGVLDRKRQDVYDAERRLLQSSDVSVQERARLGKVLGPTICCTERSTASWWRIGADRSG